MKEDQHPNSITAKVLKKINCLDGLLPNRIIIFCIFFFNNLCALISIYKGSFQAFFFGKFCDTFPFKMVNLECI